MKYLTISVWLMVSAGFTACTPSSSHLGGGTPESAPPPRAHALPEEPSASPPAVAIPPTPPSSPPVTPSPAPTPDPTPTPAPQEETASITALNLAADEEVAANTSLLLQIKASAGIRSVRVKGNGFDGGAATPHPEDGTFRYRATFARPGDVTLELSGYPAQDKTRPLAQATYHLRVVAPRVAPVPPPSPNNRNFNAYVLKAVDYLNKNYGLRGYNISAAFTHDLPYYTYGTVHPTKGGRTMCVAGVYEVILTAFELYLKDTGDHSPYDFLPFHAWSSFNGDSMLARIWVDPKIGAYGTGDALAHFGMGERVKFRDLEPGGFVNINRTNRTGHAVVFMGFLDAQGHDLAAYGPDVAGFKYFGAQGRSAVGQGGFGFEHAFFSRSGCPTVPYPRDCGVLDSDDQHVLNVGMLWSPRFWRHPVAANALSEQESDLSGDPSFVPASPAAFNGLTTDD